MPTYWDLFLPLSWDVSKEFKLPSLTSYCFSVTSHLSLRFFSSALFNIFLPSLAFFCLVLTLHLNLFQPRLHSSSHTFQRRTYAYFFIPTIQRNIHGILADQLKAGHKIVENALQYDQCSWMWLYIIVASLGREQQLMKLKIHLNKFISHKYINMNYKLMNFIIIFSGSGVQPRRTGGGEGHNHRNPESEHAHLTR